MEKITIYYFGNPMETIYKGVVTTKKTFRKWKEEGNKKATDIAFIFEGQHKDLQGYEVQDYKKANKVTQLISYHI